MNKRKNTIYRQFASCFLLIVLPIVVCGCVLILWQINRIKRETEKNISAEVYYGTKRLETLVEGTKMFQYYLTNDGDLRQFVQQYDLVPVYDYYSLLSTVKKRIDMSMEGKPEIENITIYFRDIGISVSHEKNLDYVSEEEYQELHRKTQQCGSVLRAENGQLHSSQIFSFIRWDRAFEMIIDIRLSKEYILENILNQNLDDSTVFLIYDHESGQLLSDGAEEETAAFIGAYIRTGKEGDDIRRFRYDHRKYLLVSRYSDYLDQTIYQCSPDEELLTGSGLGILLLLIYLILSVSVALRFPGSVRRIVMIPIQRLTDAFRQVADNQLDTHIDCRASDEFNYLYDEFNDMVRRLKNLIDENYSSRLRAQQAELLAGQAELKQLQAQIHPHFLYNTYFMMHRMIQDGDEEDALKLSGCLGTFFEYITHNAYNDATLEQELYYVRSYLEIQQFRFEGRMKLSVAEVPMQFRKFKIPRLILQPVVENYLKHGYEVSDGAGELYIRFSVEPDCIVILVGGGCTAVEPEKIQAIRDQLDAEGSECNSGLVNVHRRLKIRFGHDSGICLETDEEGKLITKLRIHYE